MNHHNTFTVVCHFEGWGAFLKFLLNFTFEINLHNKKETKESNIYKYSEIITLWLSTFYFCLKITVHPQRQSGLIENLLTWYRCWWSNQYSGGKALYERGMFLIFFPQLNLIGASSQGSNFIFSSQVS